MTRTDPSSGRYPCSVAYDAATRAEWLALTVPESEYDRRRRQVRREVAALGFDALLVVGNQGDPANVAYLCNYTPHFGTTFLLLPLSGEPIVVSDAVLHGEPMHSMLWNVYAADVRPAGHRADSPLGTVVRALAEAIREHGLGSSMIGVASPLALASLHSDQLLRELPRVTWKDGTMALLRPRSIKSRQEIAHMRRACEITAAGLEEAMRVIQPGITEREVASAAHAAMFVAGAEDLGFDTAVSSGPRAGLKHAAPTERALEAGDMVFLDMGAVVGGYHADLSRCVTVEAADDDARRMLEAARAIFQQAFDVVRPGASVQSIYRAAARAARESGFADDYMPNGLGHGLGLSLFELPFLSPDDETALEEGMIFALEPMLVRYGEGTAVVEETVLVTETGAETLSDLRW
jgi:Xaa-Pro aminopeptidase